MNMGGIGRGAGSGAASPRATSNSGVDSLIKPVTDAVAKGARAQKLKSVKLKVKFKPGSAKEPAGGSGV